jgi:signal transduction histidine kinase
MWSRIKHLSIPISIKLTLLYTAILSCILLFTSALTVTGLYYVLYSQANNDIYLSSQSVTKYLAADNEINPDLLKENLLVPGVILKVFDEQKRLVLDSAPYVRGNHKLLNHDKEDLDENLALKLLPIKNRILHAIKIDDVHFFAAEQIVHQNGHIYHLYFMKVMSEQAHFLKTLVKSLLVANCIGLLIAIVSGIFISRKILHPIRDITDTAKEIGVSDLGRRIALTGSNDELQELIKTFNFMLNRIQKGFEQQRRFVSDASHELRTPITVISGYADMLDRWGKQDPAVLAEGIEAIKSEAANMYGLIEKLLFLARADQSKQVINKARLEVSPLLNEVIQETRLIAPKHQIVLQNNEQAAILADGAAIKQMLRIFIENSMKYTPAGGTIRMSSQKTGNQLELTIEDTGIGIPEEDQPKVFDRFYRVDKSRSKDTGGTGLGLSIARWIIEQHDGTIRLSSKLNEGTIIQVRLPLPDQE